MNPTTIASALLVLAAIVWVAIRQTRWTALDPARALRAPLILGAVGVFQLVGSGASTALNAADIALLVIELALGAGVGVAIGLLAHVRPITEEALRAHAASRRSGDPAPTLEARNGVVGLVLWLALIAVRIGLGFWAGSWGAQIAESAGMILIVLAVNRLVRYGVIVARSTRLPVARA
ncbi:MAG: hypothetical protein EPO52_12775 [Herbiconiux sp.]|uniref:hypothetical protein n=1 Tax=Herbiconiux sp. TaxID=1871186 RepID=UPI00120FDA79|nr:hypothetical protein [Herbiconiux sp.]TAJ47155.1 MAG: hypothetical protein EPO52_12775 [Herbiconiux sp.]